MSKLNAAGCSKPGMYRTLRGKEPHRLLWGGVVVHTRHQSLAIIKSALQASKGGDSWHTFVMPEGFACWIMFLPYTSPDAPCFMSSCVRANNSASGAFPPPLTSTGTGAAI